MIAHRSLCLALYYMAVLHAKFDFIIPVWRLLKFAAVRFSPFLAELINGTPKDAGASGAPGKPAQPRGISGTSGSPVVRGAEMQRRSAAVKKED